MKFFLKLLFIFCITFVPIMFLELFLSERMETPSMFLLRTVSPAIVLTGAILLYRETFVDDVQEEQKKLLEETAKATEGASEKIDEVACDNATLLWRTKQLLLREILNRKKKTAEKNSRIKTLWRKAKKPL